MDAMIEDAEDDLLADEAWIHERPDTLGYTSTPWPPHVVGCATPDMLSVAFVVMLGAWAAAIAIVAVVAALRERDG